MCKQNHFSRTTNNNYYRVHNLSCRHIHIHNIIIYYVHINVIQYYFIFLGLASGF